MWQKYSFIKDKDLMRLFGFPLILFIFFSAFLYSQTSESPKSLLPLAFDEKRDPSVDLKYAVTLAKKEKKNILLDVGGEWCIWCKRLDEFFEVDTVLNNFLRQNFVVLKVNYSKENKNEKFLSKYPKVAGYPHFFVLNRNGRFLHSQNTGDLEAGKGYDLVKMMSFLKKWAPKK